MRQTNTAKTKNAVFCAMVSSALMLAVPLTTYGEEQSQYTFDQIVVTANRMPTPLNKSAANIAVITREQIEKGNYQSLQEVLRTVNGVIVTSQGHPGAQQFVRLHGDDRVVILIDGRRMNIDKGAGKGRAGYDLNNFPGLGNIERIEIVKGAASALYGTDAVGGVINIITRKASGNRTSLETSIGSWVTKESKLVLEGADKEWSWLLTANQQKQEHFAFKDFQSNSVKDMPNSHYDKKGLTFRLDKEIDDHKSITLQVEHANDKSGQPYAAPGYKTPDSVWGGTIFPGESLHYPDDYKTTLSNNWALTYNFNQGLDTAGYFRIYENYFSSDLFQKRNGIWSSDSYSNKASGAEWQDGWKLNDRNILVGGAEWRDTRVNNAGKYHGRSVTNKAVYLEDRLTLGEKWTVTPGIRYDNHNMFGSKSTARVAVNYQLDDTTNIYTTWSQIFNAPNTDDLFWPDTGGVAGNPNLKPETGDKTTVGINKKLDKKTELSASYFRSQLNDAINWAPDTTGKWIPSNVDKQRNAGAEIEIKTILSPEWSVAGAYSYLKVENKTRTDTEYSNDLNNSQPNGYHLRLNYTKNAWDVGVTGHGASGRSLSRFSSSGYWVWDMSASYKFDNNTRGYFKVNNITNRAYEINGNQTSNGGVGAFPMPARYYQVGLQYSF